MNRGVAVKTTRHGTLVAKISQWGEVRPTNPLKIQDVTFRDAHQSIFATRVRTQDLLVIAEKMDRVGFHSMEVWGGATFDTMHRFLGEDPWERIRVLKRHMGRTPFSMLLRGQNLVGYRNYPDDVAEAFVERCCINGIDIFRIFDALNDFRNFETVVRVVKEHGKHFQGAICYSLTERRMGGEVYTLEYYLDKAKELEDMGADSVCIKDMAGLISPYDAYVLVKALKERVRVPIHFHSHFTSGMADMSLLKAVEAGVDIVDTCLSAWAYRSSHPAVEPLVVTLMNTSRACGLDLGLLSECSELLEEVSRTYRHLLDDRTSIVDANVLLHQIPGGMISNLVNQLREMDALPRLKDVYGELPRVRKDLGQVPLVTPTSQIVGIQAVNNVLFDKPGERYSMITAQVKDLCYGLYGKTPAPIDEQVRTKALKDHPRGSTPIHVRPADILEPELEKAREETAGLARDIDDVLVYALYPTTGKRFLRWKYGLEEIPAEVTGEGTSMPSRQGPPPAQGKDAAEGKCTGGDSLRRDVQEGLGGPRRDENAGFPVGATRYRLYVDGQCVEFALEQVAHPAGGLVSRGGSQRPGLELREKRGLPADPVHVRHEVRNEEGVAREGTGGEAPGSPGDGDTPVTAPMPGMVVRYVLGEGERVAKGDVLVVLEAMKMENFITAPSDGVVKKICMREGQAAKKGDVLAVVSAP